jgi:hypothetical protein
MRHQLVVVSVITIEIDSSALIAIIIAVVGIIGYVTVLEYRFRRVENHPFIKGLRQIQDEDLMDLARSLLDKTKKGDKP